MNLIIQSGDSKIPLSIRFVIGVVAGRALQCDSLFLSSLGDNGFMTRDMFWTFFYS